MTYCQRRSPLALVVLITLAGHTLAADKVAFMMPIAEFRQLSPTEQKAILVSTFEHRLEHAKNILFEAQVRMGGYEYRNGQVGKQVFELNGRNYRLWRLGDSYRMDSERGGVDVAKPNEFLSSGFDPREGIGRSTARFSGDNRTFGRIDVVPDGATTADNRLAYWLDGTHVPMGEYLFRYLVDHKDGYTIKTPASQQTVHLIVPWTPIHSDKPLGTREFFLESQKGFLPVRGKGRWEEKSSNGETDWRTEEFEVKASKLVGDVWMPMELKELLGTSNIPANVCNVMETKVTKIEWGTVVSKDLEITFPTGTKIVDAIKGETYVVGAKGEPTRVERVVGARQGINSPKAPARKRNVMYIWIGVGLLIVVAILIAWKLRGKKRAKVEG